MEDDQIITDDQRKRRLLEEEEDILKRTQRKGEQLIQKTLSDIYRIVQPSAVDSEPFNREKQGATAVESAKESLVSSSQTLERAIKRQFGSKITKILEEQQKTLDKI